MKRPILIVEDSQFDVELMVRRLKRACIKNRPILFKDGENAFNYLALCNRPNTPLEHVPLMILLDINLPGVGGKSLLHYAKRANRLKLIPVIVLSTSACQTDVEHCYKMGANSFVTKSTDQMAYGKTISNIFDYWLRIASIPAYRV